MKKMIKVFGLTYCLLNLNPTNAVLATSPDNAFGSPEEQIEQTLDPENRDDSCRLFYVKKDFGLQLAGMEEREPINTLHFFVASMDGKIINNAQVVTTLHNEQGESYAVRALPFKSGYTIDIAPYPAGQYLAEVEIVADHQLRTKMFRFAKA